MTLLKRYESKISAATATIFPFFRSELYLNLSELLLSIKKCFCTNITYNERFVTFFKFTHKDKFVFKVILDIEKEDKDNQNCVYRYPIEMRPRYRMNER